MKFVLGLVAVTMMTAAATAAEQKIAMKDLPPAVRAAVEAETQGATVKGLTQETDKGKTFYEAETMRNGRSRDLLFDATGQLVEVEEAIDLTAVPAAVKAAFEHQGTIVKVESVTRGQTVTYEAVVTRHGKRSEVAVDAAGKPMK
jgi:uncharacterized membrane protein YkoI